MTSDAVGLGLCPESMRKAGSSVAADQTNAMLAPPQGGKMIFLFSSIHCGHPDFSGSPKNDSDLDRPCCFFVLCCGKNDYSNLLLSQVFRAAFSRTRRRMPARFVPSTFSPRIRR